MLTLILLEKYIIFNQHNIYLVDDRVKKNFKLTVPKK